MSATAPPPFRFSQDGSRTLHHAPTGGNLSVFLGDLDIFGARDFAPSAKAPPLPQSQVCS